MSLKDLLGYSTPSLKMTMMGPRGSGKTTILTSIFSNSIQDFAPTQLFLSVKANTPGSSILNTRKSELLDIFSKKGDISGVTATSKEDTLNFELGIKGGDPVVNIDIKDFPGEYLTSRKADVKQYIEESDVILLAIDTPYLMEGDDALNEEMNKVDLVINYFDENSELVKNKLVLLVPLKCEKYFLDQEIEDVSDKVEKKYEKLIAFFKKNNIASAITPIKTLGDVVFDKFEKNEREIGVSKIAKYKFANDNPSYRPMYCVQPLYYLLTYVADYNEWLKKQDSGTIIERIKKKILNLLMSNRDFNNEIKNLRRFMLTNTDGFRIVTGNSIWSIN
jgi:GTPase SAR1 family protein